MKPVFIYRGDRTPVNLAVIVDIRKGTGGSGNRILFEGARFQTIWDFESPQERDEVYNRILEKFGQPV